MVVPRYLYGQLRLLNYTKLLQMVLPVLCVWCWKIYRLSLLLRELFFKKRVIIFGWKTDTTTNILVGTLFYLAWRGWENESISKSSRANIWKLGLKNQYCRKFFKGLLIWRGKIWVKTTTTTASSIMSIEILSYPGCDESKFQFQKSPFKNQVCFVVSCQISVFIWFSIEVFGKCVLYGLIKIRKSVIQGRNCKIAKHNKALREISPIPRVSSSSPQCLMFS